MWRAGARRGRRAGGRRGPHRSGGDRAPALDPAGQALELHPEQRGLQLDEPAAAAQLHVGVLARRAVVAKQPHALGSDRLQCQEQRVGARGYARPVGHPAERGQFAFEGAILGPQDEPAPVEDAGGRLHQLGAEGLVLPLEIDLEDHRRAATEVGTGRDADMAQAQEIDRYTDLVLAPAAIDVFGDDRPAAEAPVDVDPVLDRLLCRDVPGAVSAQVHIVEHHHPRFRLHVPAIDLLVEARAYRHRPRWPRANPDRRHCTDHRRGTRSFRWGAGSGPRRGPSGAWRSDPS